MDIPGPFETVATEAYYNMTLPDPKLSAAETEESTTNHVEPDADYLARLPHLAVE